MKRALHAMIVAPRDRFSVLIPLLGLCLLALPRRIEAAGNTARDMAREVLAATGVKGGLAIVLRGNTPSAELGRAGEFAAAVAADGPFVVQGLYSDEISVGRARTLFRSLGNYGKMTAEQRTTAGLPYADNVVNLLVVEEFGDSPPAEVLRILSPGGVAYVKQGNAWQRLVKPRPAAIDEWTHYLHDASGNAVAHDTVVGPPRHLQWLASPAYSRHHERLASVSAMVSAGGRIFSIVDEGLPASILFPARWALIARDAFSGVLLWRRPLKTWAPHLWPLFDGPPELSRRLVAVGDRVYVTLGYPAPVTALDAATGQVVRIYAGTENTEEILLHGGILVLATGAPAAETAKQKRRGRWGVVRTPEPARGLLAVGAASGATLWRKPKANVYAMTTSVHNGRVFYQTPASVVCLDVETGAELWSVPRPSPPNRPTWSAPTLVAYGDVVLSVDRNADVGAPPRGSRVHSPKWSLYYTGGPGKLIAYAAATGKRLWSCNSYDTHRAPGDLFVIDGLVWVGSARIRNTEDYTTGRDPVTGEVKRTLSTAKAFASVHHHRCYRDKATDRFILLARTGTEFIDMTTGDSWRHNWVRGECQLGVMPCNGLLYAPPHPCACYSQAKLNGFLALAPARPDKLDVDRSPRLVSGPAGGDALGPASSGPEEWPTFRAHPSRDGSVKTRVPIAGLNSVWKVRIGGRLSSPVMADGRVVVASVDDHAVMALDADDGARLWRFTAGARIDSPPTLHRGRVVFGCRDGWVYCLRARDGALVWRFRAAPAERRIVVRDQLESVWPVHGSVLVRNDVAYCVAGRSSFLDGGLRLYALDMQSGKLLREHPIIGREAGKDRVDSPKWVHVAVTWDGKTARGYINGQARRTSSGNVPGARVYKGLRIGHRLDRAFFKGAMDNVRIYRRALSREEIGAIYEFEAARPEATRPARPSPPNDDLVLYLGFDEGKGSVAHDRSGSSRDAELHGASWVRRGDGFALQFNGKDAWIDCGTAKQLDVDAPITLSVWLRPDSYPKGAKDALMVLGSGPAHWNSPYSLCVGRNGFAAHMNNAKTGKRRMISWAPEGHGLEMPGGLPDILAASGNTIHLRELAFDPKTLAPAESTERHIFGSDGFLSGAWWHRAYWIYGTDFRSGAAGWFLSGRRFPAGKILAANDTAVFGYGMKPDNYRWSTPLGYQLFAARKNAESVPIFGRKAVRRPGALPGKTFAHIWSRDIPIHGRAMVVTDNALFVAGPPAVMDEGQMYARLAPTGPSPAQLLDAEAAFMGRRGAKLLAVKLADGATVSEYPLASPPVFDGLIAAGGRLFMSAMDGSVVCLGPGGKAPPPAPARP
ncbi:MAG: PQQ-binding-like beta-propeller repeat protein [Kiritimatiellaeota bacterium]|nr:PQQ-binding-like beta-propeller repeat protein [Kiritimatiellota bacterium]